MKRGAAFILAFLYFAYIAVADNSVWHNEAYCTNICLNVTGDDATNSCDFHMGHCLLSKGNHIGSFGTINGACIGIPNATKYDFTSTVKSPILLTGNNNLLPPNVPIYIRNCVFRV